MRKLWFTIVMLVVIILAFVFLEYTRYGRALYAVGGNIEAARLAGVNVNRYRTLAYALSAILATVGGFLIGASILPFMWNVFVSRRNGAIAGDDPWEGNTLEWATSSPPPPYNFARLPEIRSERPLFDARHGRVEHGGAGEA